MKVVQVRIREQAHRLMKLLSVHTNADLSTLFESAILVYAQSLGVPDSIISKGITDGSEEDDD